MEEHPESDLADEGRLRRSGPWVLIGLVVVATVAAVLMVPDDTPQDTAGDGAEPTSGVPATVPAPSLLPRPAERESAKDAPTAPAPRPAGPVPGSQARQIIAEARARGDVDPAEIAGAANRALADGYAEDAYLLYFFAARAGDAAAALALGSQADPAYRDADAGLFDAPDLTQAHKWYQLAADNGNAEARQRLTELRRSVEQRAATGDPEAQRMILQWQR